MLGLVGHQCRLPVLVIKMPTSNLEPLIGILKSATIVENGPNEDDVLQLVCRLNIGELEETQKQQLLCTLSKYHSTFSKDEDNIGYYDLVSHIIVTLDDQPMKIPSCRIPQHHWNKVREYLKKTLDRGIIQELSSPYASPIVLLRKKHGKL